MIVDREMHASPTGPIDAVATVAGDAVAGPYDAAEFLDVQVQQIARRGVLVAHHRRRRLEPRQPIHPLTGKPAAHGRYRHALLRGDRADGQAVPAQGQRRVALASIQRGAQPMRTTAAIDQPRIALGAMARQPFTRAALGDSGIGSGGLEAGAVDAVDQGLSTQEGQSGMLMAVHPAP